MKEMKKFLLALLVVALPMGMIACSDDDKDDDVKLAEVVEGTYSATGVLDLTLPTTPDARAEQSGEGEGEGEGEGDDKLTFDLKLTKTGNNEVTISFTGLTYETIPVTIADVKGVKLTGTDKTVSFKEENLDITVAVGTILPSVAAKITLNGTVTDGKTAKMTASVSIPTMAGIKVEVKDIEGTKK